MGALFQLDLTSELREVREANLDESAGRSLLIAVMCFFCKKKCWL